MSAAVAQSLTSRPAAGWRRWRAPLLIVAFVLLGGIAVAMLKPAARPAGYLDPAGVDYFGSHALADILAARGHPVTSTHDVAAALAAAQPGDATLLVVNPDALGAAALRRLASTPADIMLIEPGTRSLAAVAPSVHLAGVEPVQLAVQPHCQLPAAQLAGDASAGGIAFDISAAPAGTVGCYPANGRPSLVRYTSGGQVITIVGNGGALSNGLLASRGNAALALNLLSSRPRVIWLTPELSAAGAPPPGQRSLFSLLPEGVYLVVLQLGVAVLLAALWRGRRLGPLVPERLPVVVRASETVRGHARLYQAHRARDRAASALREAMLARVLPALGLARDARREAVVAALAGRCSLGAQAIEAAVYGPPPAGDAELVALATKLDELERQVRAS